MQRAEVQLAVVSEDGPGGVGLLESVKQYRRSFHIAEPLQSIKLASLLGLGAIRLQDSGAVVCEQPEDTIQARSRFSDAEILKSTFVCQAFGNTPSIHSGTPFLRTPTLLTLSGDTSRARRYSRGPETLKRSEFWFCATLFPTVRYTSTQKV